MERTPGRRGRPVRKAVFESLDAGMDDLRRVGGLPHPAQAASIWRGIWHEETHNSTAIEGNTLALRQVRLLLDEGLAVGDKELREYLEVQAYGEAAEWVYQQASGAGDWQPDGLLSITELRQIHKLVVEPVWAHFPPDELHPDEGPGSFRHHELGTFQGGMTPPAFVEVPGLVDDWLSAVDDGPAERQHLVEHLALLHSRFERIHPFRDGNGRSGRLAINLLLVRRGYPPAIIRNRDRPRYIRALIRADQRGDIGALAELIARAINDGINRFLLPSLAGPVRLVPLAALATPDLSASALRLAAQRGRLRARLDGSRWLSTRQWVEEYQSTRYQRVGRT